MTVLSMGRRWLTGPMSPSVAKTAVTPSSSGMPAATSAPNVSSRMRSVRGSDSIIDFDESSF